MVFISISILFHFILFVRIYYLTLVIVLSMMRRNHTQAHTHNVTNPFSSVSLGYWRYDLNGSIAECPYDDYTCRGGNQTQSGNSLCLNDFTGALCGKCTNLSINFFSRTSISCQKCSSALLLSELVLLVPLVLIILYLIWRKLGHYRKFLIFIRGQENSDHGSVATDKQSYSMEGNRGCKEENIEIGHKPEESELEEVDYCYEIVYENECFDKFGTLKLMIHSFQICSLLPIVLGTAVSNSTAFLLDIYGLLSWASPVFYPLTCVTQAMNFQILMQIASIAPAFLLSFSAIGNSIETCWAHSRKSGEDILPLLLHKIQLKYTTYNILIFYVATAAVCYLASGSIQCVSYTGIETNSIPSAILLFLGYPSLVNTGLTTFRVLKNDVDVDCTNNDYANNKKWAYVALVIYGILILVNEGRWKYSNRKRIVDYQETSRLAMEALIAKGQNAIALKHYKGIEDLARNHLLSSESLMQLTFSEYRSNRSGWDTLQHFQRLLLLAGIVLLSFGKSTNRAMYSFRTLFALIVSVLFLLASIVIRPYENRRNNILCVVINIQIFIISASIMFLKDNNEGISSILFIACLLSPLTLFSFHLYYIYRLRTSKQAFRSSIPPIHGVTDLMRIQDIVNKPLVRLKQYIDSQTNQSVNNNDRNKVHEIIPKVNHWTEDNRTIKNRRKEEISDVLAYEQVYAVDENGNFHHNHYNDMILEPPIDTTSAMRSMLNKPNKSLDTNKEATMFGFGSPVVMNGISFSLSSPRIAPYDPQVVTEQTIHPPISMSRYSIPIPTSLIKTMNKNPYSSSSQSNVPDLEQ